MARRVHLHVGTLKTGTTYLQRVLWHNREALRDAGLLVAGESYPDRVWAAQHLRGAEQDDRQDRAWERIVAQCAGFDGDAVISHEFLGALDTDTIDRVLADLAPAEVHVLVTARNLAAVLPSFWQERLKFGATGTLRGFEPSGYDAPVLDHWSWRLVDAADVAGRWGHSLPPERVHVVTYPGPGAGPDALWRRFAGVLGVDPALADTDLPTANSSMGVVQAELMRRFNEDLPEELRTMRHRWLRRHLGEETLAPRSTERLTLPAERHAAVRERSAAVAERLRAGGYDVVGDLDELLDPAEPTDGRAPEDASEPELLAAAVQAMRDLVMSHRGLWDADQRLQREHERTARELARVRRRLERQQEARATAAAARRKAVAERDGARRELAEARRLLEEARFPGSRTVARVARAVDRRVPRRRTG